MKIKCIKNNYEIWKNSGLFTAGGYVTLVYEGLSLNKVYNAQVVSFVTGGGYSTNAETAIEFMIFNDQGKWKTYPTHFFEDVV